MRGVCLLILNRFPTSEIQRQTPTYTMGIFKATELLSALEDACRRPLYSEIALREQKDAAEHARRQHSRRYLADRSPRSFLGAPPHQEPPHGGDGPQPTSRQPQPAGGGGSAGGRGGGGTAGPSGGTPLASRSDADNASTTSSARLSRRKHRTDDGKELKTWEEVGVCVVSSPL